MECTGKNRSHAESACACDGENPSSFRHWKTLFGCERANAHISCPIKKCHSPFFTLILLLVWCHCVTVQSHAANESQPELNDVHFHLTNYIQEGTDIHD